MSLLGIGPKGAAPTLKLSGRPALPFAGYRARRTKHPRGCKRSGRSFLTLAVIAAGLHAPGFAKCTYRKSGPGGQLEHTCGQPRACGQLVGWGEKRGTHSAIPPPL